MICRRRICCLAAAALLLSLGEFAPAQWGRSTPGGQFELSDAVQVDRADSAVLAQWERAKSLVAERQWDEAVELLRQLTENTEGRLVAIAPRRYVPLREACQWQLASLPPEALKLYRGRVDSVAQRWYERGIARRDQGLLQDVVDQAFGSSVGDLALLALGDIAFESGDFAAARWNWTRIVGGARGGGREAGDEGRGTTGNQEKRPVTAIAGVHTWPNYPDSRLDLAAVRARIVLASIVEGRIEQARAELAEFARLHPEAQGRLGDHEGKYVDLLNTILIESNSWRPEPARSDWPTFAGNSRRDKIAAPLDDIGVVAWRVPLRAKNEIGEESRRRIALGENPAEPLSFYPVAAGDSVFVNDDRRILAVRRTTGRPAWGKTATIYESELPAPAGAPPVVPDAFGLPRYTMTIFHDRLYARMGAAVTSLPQGTTTAVHSGYLVCLDLAAQGRLLWKIAPEDGWAFEGSPVADEHGVYVGMRRRDVRPQAMVACFEPDTGKPRWRRFVCGAETPARGVLAEYSHNLLTLSHGTLYYNTNLGAVAAFRADDGRILWLTLYPRDLRGTSSELAPHWLRAANPCVLSGGTLLAAPSDSARIFAFSACTGRPLWQSGTELDDAVDLLGTTDDWLIAGGKRLYWISLNDADRGRVKHVWPDGAAGPGFGRGVLAGQNVLWSTRDKLYIFDQKTAQLRKVLNLAVRVASGGNLLVADGQLLIATENELLAISPESKSPQKGGQTFLSVARADPLFNLGGRAECRVGRACEPHQLFQAILVGLVELDPPYTRKLIGRVSVADLIDKQ